MAGAGVGSERRRKSPGSGHGTCGAPEAGHLAWGQGLAEEGGWELDTVHGAHSGAVFQPGHR